MVLEPGAGQEHAVGNAGGGGGGAEIVHLCLALSSVLAVSSKACAEGCCHPLSQHGWRQLPFSYDSASQSSSQLQLHVGSLERGWCGGQWMGLGPGGWARTCFG